MSAEYLEQRLSELEKALTGIDTARAKLVEDIRILRLRMASRDHSPERPSVTGKATYHLLRGTVSKTSGIAARLR